MKKTIKKTSIIIIPIFFLALLVACGPSDKAIAEAVAATLTAQITSTPTTSPTPVPSKTPTPTSTATLTPTPSPLPTDTPTPTSTVTPTQTETPIPATQTYIARLITQTAQSEAITATAEMRYATQTAQSAVVTNTAQARYTNQTATASIIAAQKTEVAKYKEIYWKDLVNYTDDHVGEFVIVRGRVFNINSNEEFQMWIAGTYEALYVVTRDRFSSLYENDAVTVYGIVYGEHCGTNAFGGSICQPVLIDAWFSK